MEPMTVWVRKIYDVLEPSRQHPYMVRAYNRESGLEVGRWLQGQQVPLWMWQQYLDGHPEEKAEVEKEKRHKLLHDPLRISLR